MWRRRTQSGTQIAGVAALVSASLLAGSCERAPEPAAAHARVSPGRVRPGDARSTSATQYLGIAEAANRRLEIDFDALAGSDRSHLADALADLRDASSTERTFDRDLLRLSLPPVLEPTARDLVRANESRARLTATFSDDRSLAQLRGDEKRLATANGVVEVAAASLRRQLGLPPPQTH